MSAATNVFGVVFDYDTELSVFGLVHVFEGAEEADPVYSQMVNLEGPSMRRLSIRGPSRRQLSVEGPSERNLTLKGPIP